MKNLTKLTNARNWKKKENEIDKVSYDSSYENENSFSELWDDMRVHMRIMRWRMKVHMELWDDISELRDSHMSSYENYESHMRVLSAGSCGSCQDL